MEKFTKYIKMAEDQTKMGLSQADVVTCLNVFCSMIQNTSIWGQFDSKDSVSGRSVAG